MEFNSVITTQINQNTPIIRIKDRPFDDQNISLYIKREDLNHPYISGNKWHKLKYNIQEAKKLDKDTLLTRQLAHGFTREDLKVIFQLYRVFPWWETRLICTIHYHMIEKSLMSWPGSFH